MNSSLSRAQQAAQRLVHCRHAHAQATDELNEALARGFGVSDLRYADAISNTAKELRSAVAMDFLARDLERDERIRMERLSRTPSPFKRFLIRLW